MKTYNFIEACNSGKKFGFQDRPTWHISSGYEEFEDTDDWFSHLIDHSSIAQNDILN